MCCPRCPFAREYGGLLANRSFGGARCRTFMPGADDNSCLVLQCLEQADRRRASFHAYQA